MDCIKNNVTSIQVFKKKKNIKKKLSIKIFKKKIYLNKK